MASTIERGSLGGSARVGREAAASSPAAAVKTNARRVIMGSSNQLRPVHISQNAVMGITGISHWCYDSVSHHASRFGAHHGQRKRPQHQEEAEVQELRGQGTSEEGRQGCKMPALWRDRGALNTISC